MLNKQLIKLRKYSGLSQKKFAKVVGCTFQHISNQERSQVSFKTLKSYAEKLGYKVKYEVELKIIDGDNDVLTVKE